ncbi:MAG: hypothetical protein JWQ98_1847 [Chlorobi bacterium]|nr:hypothetical protein [Chlorobiota bacterium]
MLNASNLRRWLIAFGAVVCLVAGVTRAIAQPYSLLDPCSKYTINMLPAETGMYNQWPTPPATGDFPLDITVTLKPQIGSSSSTPTTQTRTFTGTGTGAYSFNGNQWYVDGIMVAGTNVAWDGQPHLIPTSTNNRCLKVTITTDAAGCPVVNITVTWCTPPPYCDHVTLVIDPDVDDPALFNLTGDGRMYITALGEKITSGTPAASDVIFAPYYTTSRPTTMSFASGYAVIGVFIGLDPYDHIGYVPLDGLPHKFNTSVITTGSDGIPRHRCLELTAVRDSVTGCVTIYVHGCYFTP